MKPDDERARLPLDHRPLRVLLVAGSDRRHAPEWAELKRSTWETRRTGLSMRS